MGIAYIAILIPFVAIISHYWTENEKEKRKLLENGASLEQQPLLIEIKKEQQILLQENVDLKERLNNLETIITGIDESLLLPSARATMDDPQKKVKELSERLVS